jgi:hypothetical protein
MEKVIWKPESRREGEELGKQENRKGREKRSGSLLLLFLLSCFPD